MKYNFKRFMFSITAVSILLASGILFAAGQTSESFKMKVGKFEIIALLDSEIEMNASLVKNGDPAIIKQYMPAGKASCSINAFVVKTGKLNILIDSGMGESKFGNGKLLKNLKKADINPEDIDIILITHGHFDHVGGLVKDGKPVFSKAKLMFSKKEITTFDDKAISKLPADVKGYYEPANAALKAYKGRIETFTPGSKIAEGVSSVEMYGHTPGNVGFLFESSGETFFMLGDLLHIAPLQFPHPEISLVYDTDTVKSARMRSKILNWASSKKFIVAGSHIQFPGIGMVKKEKTGFSFSPVK